MDALRKEIETVKNFFKDMKNAGLEEGDRFRVSDGISFKSSSMYYAGADFMPFVRRGILKIVGNEFVSMGDRFSSSKVVDPEDILTGKVRGMFYTRYIYKVVIDNFDDYLKTILFDEIK